MQCYHSAHLLSAQKLVFSNLLQTRTISSAMVSLKELQKFSMETNNGEYYWAENSNNFYQSKRINFKGETFANQENLPSLPVPELKNTIEKYLKSIKPYTKNDLNLYERQELLCKNFLENDGPILQQRLIEYAKGKRNWMSEFWDNQAYLEYNDPVVPYVSYFFNHRPLPSTHKEIENDPLIKSTAIISTILRFIEAIKDESLPPELIRSIPFCMNNFQLMFNTSRLPGKPEDNRDTNIFYSIYENNFMVIAYNGNFYKVITHDKTTEKPLSPNKIWKQLYDIVNKLDNHVEAKSTGVGSLSSLPRDQWRTSYVELIKDPTSMDSLTIIHKASFMLCLDLDTKPITLEERSKNSWHGDGINRYYDKSLQFFVTGNGNSGFLGEHSKMDGTPTLFLNTYICQEINKLNPKEFIAKVFKVDDNQVIEPTYLPFNINPTVQKDIKSAQLQFKNTIDQHKLKIWHYNRYGKNLIKTFKMAPDAFIQQIIQLAVFKYLGKQLPTYEPASTRKFFKGRTEPGRPVSLASQEFVENWDNPDLSISEKIKLLKTAAAEHSNDLKMASQGQGVDRHFFGLKNMIHQNQDYSKLVSEGQGADRHFGLIPKDQKKENIPPLFKDPLFNYSGTWYICTSQLSSEYFDGYGWSQVNDIGFGLAYMLNKDWMHINIVNKPQFSGLSVDRLHYYLNQAADEIGDALIKESAQAKL